jgi:glutathione S-transferase
VIALKEKRINYQRIDIDLANKPDWFLKASPLGKTPLLLADGNAVFESNVICEYLEDISEERLHPAEPLQRARHRSWIEFASATLNTIGGFYGAPDASSMDLKIVELKAKFSLLENELASQKHDGPYFAGSAFSLVDAAFAPVFRYFEVFDNIEDFGFFASCPKVQKWRLSLQERLSVRNAVPREYHQYLRSFLLKRHSEISKRISG